MRPAKRNPLPSGVTAPPPQNVRAQLWRHVAVAVAASSNVTKASVCVDWADRVLAAYDERFPRD